MLLHYFYDSQSYNSAFPNFSHNKYSVRRTPSSPDIYVYKTAPLGQLYFLRQKCFSLWRKIFREFSLCYDLPPAVVPEQSKTTLKSLHFQNIVYRLHMHFSKPYPERGYPVLSWSLRSSELHRICKSNPDPLLVLFLRPKTLRLASGRSYHTVD